MELDRSNIQAGTPVYSSDNEHVGDVEEVGSNYILARKGWFFVKERYIPFTAIARTDFDGVYLSVAKDQLDTMAWDAPPAETDAIGTATTGPVFAAISDTPGPDTTVAHRTPTTYSDAGNAPVAPGDTVIGERVADLQASNIPPAAFEQGVFEVRARHEEFTVSKQARVVEELVVTTNAVERIQTIQETVRRTQVDITEVPTEATSTLSSGDLTSMPADTGVSGTTTGAATIVSTPEDQEVDADAASTTQPRNRRRRLR